ncbi:MAG TPA: HlyD family efflux transporter periplasmic adaptor subunit [Acidobacteriota bacterium]|jgi:HlyD family secretion protein
MIQEASTMDRVIRKKAWFKSWKAAATAGVGIVILAVVVSLYPSLRRWAIAEQSVEASRLNFGRVARGDLVRDVSVQGKIVASDHPTIVSPAQGIISIASKAGEVVIRGSVLARIESPELQNQLKQEMSTLLSLKSDLERQKITSKQAYLQNVQQANLLGVRLEANERAMKRAKSLAEQGLGNAIDYEKAQDDVKVSSLELAHAREKTKLDKETSDFEIRNRELLVERQGLVVKEVQRRISELALVSPVSGMVARVDVKDKDMVQPNQVLFSVVDLSKYQVEVLIPENFAGEIRPGTGASILYEGQEYTGQVKSISPEVENSQVKAVVVFSSASPSGLKENQRVSTRLILEGRRNVLKVPRGPFLESLGGRQAYVVEDNMARLRPIQVGAISVTEVEVVSGLDEGEEIILSDATRFEGARTLLLRK